MTLSEDDRNILCTTCEVINDIDVARLPNGAAQLILNIYEAIGLLTYRWRSLKPIEPRDIIGSITLWRMKYDSDFDENEYLDS